LTGFLSHCGEATPRWSLALTFAGIAAAGVILGSFFTSRLPVERLRQVFALMVLLTGGLVAWQNLP